MNHSFEIHWTPFGGVRRTISASDFPSHAEAMLQAALQAKNEGWTPPKWWQWWRRNDTRLSVGAFLLAAAVSA